MPGFSYSLIDTPVGTAVVVVSGEGVVALQITDHDRSLGGPGSAGGPGSLGGLEWLARELGAPPARDDSVGSEVARQLGEYFAGTRETFELTLDWRLVHGFHREALRSVCTIAYGETASYGEVAVWAGRHGAARAVGTACRLSPFSIIVPVHRVIRADGTIGEYGARPDAKRFLIDLEQNRTPDA